MCPPGPAIAHGAKFLIAREISCEDNAGDGPSRPLVQIRPLPCRTTPEIEYPP